LFKQPQERIKQGFRSPPLHEVEAVPESVRLIRVEQAAARARQAEFDAANADYHARLAERQTETNTNWYGAEVGTTRSNSNADWSDPGPYGGQYGHYTYGREM
jgi:hypothetical protein